jgi:hypothetical protein
LCSGSKNGSHDTNKATRLYLTEPAISCKSQKNREYKAMMPIIFVCSIGFYLIILGNLLVTWFGYFNKYTNPFDPQRFSYAITLVLGAVLWPVVVPIAYLSLLKRQEA